MSAAETLNRHADVLRAQLELAAERLQLGAAEMVAVAHRHPTTDPHSAIAVACGYVGEATALTVLLLDIIREASELAAVARSLDLIEGDAGEAP